MMYDVIIVGGGLHGGFSAWHLLQREPGLKIALIEKDSTYSHAASARSSAGVRVLFSQEENLRMSQYGHEVYGDFGALMAIDGEAQPLTFWRQGYVFIANTLEQAEDMTANHKLQTGMGAEADLLDARTLQDLLPSFRTDDVTLACHSPKDGWLDPYGALTSLRRKNQSLGAEYIDGVVTGFDQARGQVTSATLQDGRKLEAEWFVNGTGAWGGELSKLMGFEIPVVPLPRTQFYFECRDPVEPFGLTIDGRGCSVRPEGKGYITGRTHFERAGAFNWDPVEDHFYEENWPLAAHRVPKFEAVKLMASWNCHYAYSTWDGNMLMGAWPGQPQNFLMTTGYSGHGLQHAPAAGRAISELILDGGFQTLDLTRFAASRVSEGRKEPERGVKA